MLLCSHLSCKNLVQPNRWSLLQNQILQVLGMLKNRKFNKYINHCKETWHVFISLLFVGMHMWDCDSLDLEHICCIPTNKGYCVECVKNGENKKRNKKGNKKGKSVQHQPLIFYYFIMHYWTYGKSWLHKSSLCHTYTKGGKLEQLESNICLKVIISSYLPNICSIPLIVAIDIALSLLSTHLQWNGFSYSIHAFELQIVNY